MTTSVEIFFVGLCSFLNLHNNVAHMPPPSVVMHRAGGHQAFIAWKDTDAVLEDAANFPVGKTAAGTNFLLLDGEELSLNDDQSGPPSVDATYDNNVAHIQKYADLPGTPIFDQDRVPLKGHLPEARVEWAYLEFGAGKIASDWDTQYKFVFRDTATGAAANATPANYHRRVAYTYDTAASALVVLAHKYDNSSRRKLVFKPVSGAKVTVWMGNSMDIDEDMDPAPTVKNKNATHFKFFYDTLAVKPAKTYIPVIEGAVTTNPSKPPAHGTSTGYCGPDGQP